MWSIYLALAFVPVVYTLQLLPPAFAENGGDTTCLATKISAGRFGTWPRIIYLTEALASRRDANGLTLIPPSGWEFAQIFRDDLTAVTGEQWTVENLTNCSPQDIPGIVLDLHSQDAQAELNITYENGVSSEEGYTLNITANQALIAGTGARGAWWGTRTLLQHMMRLEYSTDDRDNTPACIYMKDAPAYATRGYLLDAGRKWYSPNFLKELCTYASFFKMSEFHYHTSDNYPLNRGHNATWQDVYAQFSLHPEVDKGLEGLVQRKNETLSRSEFESLQIHCARRGITIIPEIEAPGHCLSITKWKPELALPTKKDLLNLTHPDSIPTVKRIWAEFLPWFQTKEVHIGADEYDSTLADDYIRFVNEMSQFVRKTADKSVRIWGTHEPSQNLTISQDVIIQHWQYGQSDPVALAEEGYQVINSEDVWAYMSLKNDHTPILPAPYAQFFNESKVFNFGQKEGWQWQPSLFNPVNITEQLPKNSRQNMGAIMAAWNDNGFDATTQLEAYYAMRRGIPLVAARAWSGDRGAELNKGMWENSVEFFAAKAPGQNLDLNIKTEAAIGGSVLVWERSPSTKEEDKVELGYGSKGPRYTVTMNVTGTFTLKSDDTNLRLTEEGEMVFVSDGTPYPLRSVSVFDGFDAGHPGRIWSNTTTSTHEVVRLPVGEGLPAMEVTITGDYIGGSRVWVNGEFMGRFEVYVFGGKNTLFSWSQMAFVMPLDTLEGGVGRISVRDDIIPPKGSGRFVNSVHQLRS